MCLCVCVGGGGVNECADRETETYLRCKKIVHVLWEAFSFWFYFRFHSQHDICALNPIVFDNTHTLSRLLWSFCVGVYNLMPFDLSLTLGQPISLLSHSHLCITTKTAECYWSEQSFLSFIGSGPTCSIFEQQTEPQLNLNSSGARCAVNSL